MKKILVIGGNGQLGSCIKYVSRSEAFVDKYDFTYVDYPDIDISSFVSMDKYITGEYDGIINCAAYTNVNAAEYDKNAYILNTVAPAYIASKCAVYNMRFLTISTDYVAPYDINTPFPNDYFDYDLKSFSDKTMTGYGKSKLLGEKYVIDTMKNLGYDNYAIVRTSWLYSEYCKNFVKTIFNNIKSGKECNVVCDQIGTPTYAMDLAEVLLKLMGEEFDSYFEQDNCHVLNYSNTGVASWYDLAKEVERIYRREKNIFLDVLVKPRTTSAEEVEMCYRPNYSVMDKTYTEHILGHIPYWVDSLERCVEVLMKD